MARGAGSIRAQHQLQFPQRGGARQNAGRKRKAPRPLVPHSKRPAVVERFPLHVTMRLREDLPTLRSEAVGRVLERAFAAGRERFGFRLVHYSIQITHLHLIVEAEDASSLSRGIKGLLVRSARALNRHWSRKGPITSDRYRARPLRSPREVRHALLYVLLNARRHGSHFAGVDPWSSGRWFDGWSTAMCADSTPSACAPAKTWLLSVGWRRHGPIEIEPPRRTAA